MSHWVQRYGWHAESSLAQTGQPRQEGKAAGHQRIFCSILYVRGVLASFLVAIVIGREEAFC